MLNYWRSSHYGGAEVALGAGEKWSKTIGPFLIYVNSGADSQAIYKDARAQADKGKAKWPYDWVAGIEYFGPAQRAIVKGQLVLTDPLMPDVKMSNVLVGLTAPAYTPPAPGGRGGPAGGMGARVVDWQQDAKNYEFWVKGADDGAFEIPKVRPGTYTLHAFADGVLGEFAKTDVKVEEGKPLDMGKITWTPVRRGPQLWDIGIPHRTGTEYVKGDDYFHDGMANVYAQMFPHDVNYNIGKSDFTKDWFYAQYPHPNGPNRGVWTINFDLPSAPKGKATLRLGIATSNTRQVELAVNDQPAGTATNFIPDSFLGRNTVQGIWTERELPFDAALLKQGTNTLKLTIPAGGGTAGIVYDYLRLELDENAQ